MDAVLELLTKGREFFADHEWERGGHYYTLGEGGQIKSCCAVGALKVAAGDEDAYASTPLVSRAWDELERQLGGGVVYFNDELAESKDDILALYDRAIAARRSE